MIKGIPFDAPLYELDEDGADYQHCEAVQVFATLRGDVAALLPDGLVPASDPPLGAVMVARYGASPVGAYLEQLSMVQVMDPGDVVGFYVPYIYVTGDAALAAGRELLGAPKKMAAIGLTRDAEVVQATLERPAGHRLLTVTMQPAHRLDEDMRAMLAPRSYLYGVRHLPAFAGKGEVTQLTRWFSEVTFHRDARGEEVLLAGPASVTYDSPSIVDPVHRVAIDEVVLACWGEFDMRLGADQLLTDA